MIVDLQDPTAVECLRLLARKMLDDKQYERVAGITSGVFDLFHYMHLAYLQRCRHNCDFLIVGVDSDDLVKSFKGPKRPIYSDYQRAAIIDSLKTVDVTFVVRDLKDDYELICSIFHPIVIFKNDAFKDKVVHGQEMAKSVIIVPDVHPVNSTSEAIDAIINSEKIPSSTPALDVLA